MEKKLKPQKEVERFMIKPHYGLFLGVTVNKDTDIEDEADEGRVHQTIKGTTFTTVKKDEREKDGVKIQEEISCRSSRRYKTYLDRRTGIYIT